MNERTGDVMGWPDRDGLQSGWMENVVPWRSTKVQC
jgi:hypothetical protein